MVNLESRLHKTVIRSNCAWKYVLCASLLSFGCTVHVMADNASRPANPFLDENGLSPAKEFESGVCFMIPAGYFTRVRPTGSTTVADLDGSNFNLEIVKSNGHNKTEAEMSQAINELGPNQSDRKNEKSIKVHGFSARQWSFKNELGATKIMVVGTPKFMIRAMWHADEDKSATHGARDTFFNSIDPNYQNEL